MIVVDASAIVAIIQQERGYERLATVMASNHPRYISPVSWLEVTLALLRDYDDAAEVADAYLAATAVEVISVNPEQAKLARAAYLRFGKGRHPARLNLGDCFSYAAAKYLRSPLLYVGGDFAKTDIRSA